MAITHQNGMAKIALQYRDIISTAGWTVDKEVKVVQVNESLEQLNIHVVPLVQYRGIFTDGCQKMGVKFEA